MPASRAGSPTRGFVGGPSIRSLKLNLLQCDGEEPCSSCRGEKRKSRTCEYSVQAKRIALARREGELKKAYRHQRGGTESDDSDIQTFRFQQPFSRTSTPRQKVPYMSTSSVQMHKKLSLCRVVNEVRECLWPGQWQPSLTPPSSMK